MTTQVPATSSGRAVGVMKSEIPETSEEDDCDEEEDDNDGEGDAEGEEDVDSGSQENEDGELFDYIYGSESNDNYVGE